MVVQLSSKQSVRVRFLLDLMSRKAQDLKLAKIGFQAASGAEMQQLVDRKGDKKLNKKGKQSYKGKGVEGPKQVSGEYKNPY